MHAIRAVELAGDKGSQARLLLGQIYFAEGKTAEARTTWQKLVDDLPNDPAAIAAKRKLEETAVTASKLPENSDLPLPKVVVRRGSLGSWKVILRGRRRTSTIIPPASWPLLAQRPEVLDRAFLRTKNQLANFEKFTATEHIEHQEIDRHGIPIKVKTREFSYIVFVVPYRGDSFYLEESRDA